MTYVNPTPEDAFDDLEFLTEIAAIDNRTDADICSAFQSGRGYKAALRVWLDPLYQQHPDEKELPSGLMKRLQEHVVGCYLCGEQFSQHLNDCAEIESAIAAARKALGMVPKSPGCYAPNPDPGLFSRLVEEKRGKRP